MAAWNLVTPSSAINYLIRRGMESLPALFDEEYLTWLQGFAWNHEDTAGNPLHLALFSLSSLILVATLRRSSKSAALYFGAVFTGYMLIPYVSSAGGGPWGLRYQLPFFVLAGPVIAIASSRVVSGRLSRVLCVMLLLTVVPYLLLNNTRPIIGRTPWPTRVDSIFRAPEREILLAMLPEARQAYYQVADEVGNRQCKEVGLRIDSDDLEYALWWLLQAPQSGTRIEVLYPLSSLDNLVDRSFRPCAVVCSLCGDDRATLNGLELVSDFGLFKVYAGPGFTWEQDLR